jgi:hypothetical protein
LEDCNLGAAKRNAGPRSFDRGFGDACDKSGLPANCRHVGGYLFQSFSAMSVREETTNSLPPVHR